MYDGVGGVRDHIIKLKHCFNKANEMKVDALKEEWTLEELMSIVVQHEILLKKNETHSLALVTDQVSNRKKKPPHKNSGGSKQFKRKGNLSQGAFNASASSNATKNEKFKGSAIFATRLGTSKEDDVKRPKRRGLIGLELGKLIKAIKSNRGGDYYGRYDETGRNPGPFTKFLLECGIDARYTMLDTPQQNGVAERRNHTLLDMVRCMLSNSFLPEFLWETEPSPFPCLGCKAEIRPYNLQLKKFDPKTISGFFVGYCIGSRGSRFYCPSHTTRIIESDRVVYFEDEVNIDPNFMPHEIPFGEEHVIIPFPTSHVPNVDVPIVQQPTTNQGENGDQVEPGIPVDDTIVDGITLRRSQRSLIKKQFIVLNSLLGKKP
ncbi:Retrovirus-related Pol polyprotein from transposon TNT 1-94 [Vitis vinifera]|uniref:Retrovirus-related Pol polyprotein from transposon TNT 1-94 n=1 Tax=Vitis vinifera TaxID=29760 RepID=A0A438EHT2_VITVI|nr:Retrovirus-related Pol polyprotein from transposon TNT 1-94 [Vitis vinifera]